jgi:hypothetical protein
MLWGSRSTPSPDRKHTSRIMAAACAAVAVERTACVHLAGEEVDALLNPNHVETSRRCHDPAAPPWQRHRTAQRPNGPTAKRPNGQTAKRPNVAAAPRTIGPNSASVTRPRSSKEVTRPSSLVLVPGGTGSARPSSLSLASALPGGPLCNPATCILVHGGETTPPPPSRAWWRGLCPHPQHRRKWRGRTAIRGPPGANGGPLVARTAEHGASRPKREEHSC